jgi:hypothetical protein
MSISSGSLGNPTRHFIHKNKGDSAECREEVCSREPASIQDLRCRIVLFLRFQADAVIRYVKGTDQHLGSTVVTKK